MFFFLLALVLLSASVQAARCREERFLVGPGAPELSKLPEFTLDGGTLSSSFLLSILCLRPSLHHICKYLSLA